MAVKALDHLLEIEAQASAMVKGAQEEADKRVHENEEKKRIEFDEFYKARIKKSHEESKKAVEDLKNKYQISLDEYRVQISQMKADTRKFSVLLEEYLEKG